MRPEHITEVRNLYSAPPDDPLFHLVPPAFRAVADDAYASLDAPPVTFESIWNIYTDMLAIIRTLMESDVQAGLELTIDERSAAFAGEDIVILPLAPFRAGQGVGGGGDDDDVDAGNGEGSGMPGPGLDGAEEEDAAQYSSDDPVPPLHVSEWTQMA